MPRYTAALCVSVACLFTSYFTLLAALVTSDLSVRPWILQNKNRSLSLPTTLPAYPLEVLRANNIIGFDPLYSYGEAYYRWIADETWTFSTTFNSSDPDIAPAMASSAAQLRFYGLDTFAAVQLNGKDVLAANNFHRRWFVPVKQQLVQGLNKLSITIKPATAESWTLRGTYGQWPFLAQLKGVGAFNMARKPGSDFGWDWGPAYAPTGVHGGVELAGYDNAFIQASSMTQKKANGTFRVTVVLDMQVPAAETGTAVASFDSLGQSVSQPLNFTGPGLKQVSLQLSVPESRITLWWPVRFGPQQLYTFKVTYTPSAPGIKCRAGRDLRGLSVAEPAAAGAAELDAEMDRQHKDDVQVAQACIMDAQSVLTRRVGFRTIELIRQAPSVAVKELLPAGEAGWGSPAGNGETYYIKVNGWPIFAKGANMVPLRVVHSSMTKGMVSDVIQHAVGANMNMIRIWGGGHYQVEDFYDLADQYGIMVWVESSFACAHYPTAADYLANVAAETTQQAQRLSWHPSLVMWSGNNEVEQSFDWFSETTNNRQYYMNAYVTMFVNTIRPIIRQVAPHVPYVDGSPNKGVYADDDQSYSKRWGNTNEVSRGDLHFYTYGCACDDCENPNIYPKARFVSEFGVQSYPTYDTLRIGLSRADSYVDSGNMYWRQRKFSNAPSSVFNWAALRFRMAGDWNAGDEANKKRLLQSFLFITHMQQGRCYQSALSYWRRLRANPEALTMGILYWQLNDVAAFASWSGYDSGGRWKPLAYFVQRTFAPLAVHVLEANGKVEVWVLNDLPTPLQFTITIRLLSLNKAYPNTTASACAAELKPVQVLMVKAPQNFSKWVWAISVADLLKLQPGCSRTTCYVHASTTVGQSEQVLSEATAPKGATPATADVKMSVAEAAAQAAFWPTEGVSAVQHEEAAAAEGQPNVDGATTAQWGPGSVPDVQLLLATPRAINFRDPQLQASNPTATGSNGDISVTLSASTAASHVLLTSQTLGYFSDNALMALHPCLPQTVTFIPASSLQQQPTPAAFLSGLRVESIFNHQFGSAAREPDSDQPGSDDTKRTTEQQQPVHGSSRVFNRTLIGPIGDAGVINHTAAPAPPPAT